MTEGDGENCQRMTEHLQSPQAPSCHSRRLSPTFLIGDLVKEGIQCRSLPLLCNPVGQVSDASPDIFAVRRARNLSDYASLIRPTRCQRIGEHLQSLTLVPDLIGDPVKEGIQSLLSFSYLSARLQQMCSCAKRVGLRCAHPTYQLFVEWTGHKGKTKDPGPRLANFEDAQGERSP